MESLAPLAWRFIGRVGDSLTKAMRSLRALKTIRSYATPMGALGRTPAPCFLLPWGSKKQGVLSQIRYRPSP